MKVKSHPPSPTPLRDTVVYQTIIAPHISEKSSLLSEKTGCYTFRVHMDADKETIKKALEQLFNVSVVAVRVVNMDGKQKRFGRTLGRRNHWKKAYVRLAEGQSITLMES
jgi:large subunit ribosomal protein L23